MSKAILYTDADGNEVTALDLVASVTVSVGDKVSIKEASTGNIRTIAPMISMTATIPPEQQSGEIALELARQLYAQVNSMVQGITRQKMGIPVNGNGHQEEAENAVETPPAPPQGKPAAAVEEGPEREEMPLPAPIGARQNFSPKAAERTPGQWWTCELLNWNWHTFTSKAGNEVNRITIGYQDGKYTKSLDIVPFGEHAWPPKAMREHLDMKNDGLDYSFPEGYTITFMVGHGKNKANNYEPLLVKWASSEEKARLAPAA